MSNAKDVVIDFKVHMRDSVVAVRIDSDVYMDKAFKMHILGASVGSGGDWTNVSEVQRQVDITLELGDQETASNKIFELLQAAALMSEMHTPARNVVIVKTHQLCEHVRKQNQLLKRSLCAKDEIESRALTVLSARQPERKRQRKEPK